MSVETLWEEKRALSGDPGKANLVLIFRSNDSNTQSILTKRFNTLQQSEHPCDIFTRPLESYAGGQITSRKLPQSTKPRKQKTWRVNPAGKQEATSANILDSEICIERYMQ